MYRVGTKMKTTADFFWKQCKGKEKVLKDKYACQPRIIGPKNISFKNEGKIKVFQT